MTEDTGAAGASTSTGGQADTPAAQRAALMADPAFRAGAMNPKGEQWARLSELDRQIAAQADGDDAESGARSATEPGSEAHARAIVDAQENGDDERAAEAAAMAAIYAVPDTPAGYQLPTDRARELGLPVDAQAEIELRQALHAAEVPGSVATTLYWASVTAATAQDQSPAAQETQYRQSAHALHRKWGKDYDANVALANQEVGRIFDKLPPSITKGMSCEDFCLSSGLASNRLVIETLYRRAQARGRT